MDKKTEALLIEQEQLIQQLEKENKLQAEIIDQQDQLIDSLQINLEEILALVQSLRSE